MSQSCGIPRACRNSIRPALAVGVLAASWQSYVLWPVQELSNILEALASQRANSGVAADDADLDGGAASDEDEGIDENEGVNAAGAGISSGKTPAGLLQTFVFSATLTLPQRLRKRLRRGNL